MNTFRLCRIRRATIPIFALMLAMFLSGTTFLSAQQSSIRPSASSRAGSTSTTGRTTATTGRTVGGNTNSAFTSGARQYRNNTVLGDAVIQVDPESRSLVIISDEETHAEILKIIKSLDRPKPQVLIKVLFADVVYNDDLDIGLEGAYTFHTSNPLLSALTASGTSVVTQTVNSILSSGTTNTGSVNTVTTTNTPVFPSNVRNGTLGSGGLFGLATSPSSLAAAGATGNLVSVLTSDYQATLRAIAQKGHINVLSRPSIMARNNQEAVIVVGQEVPFVTNSTINENGNVLNTIQYNDVGIILRVTPFINSNRTVEMIVAPEISQVSPSTVQVTNGVSAPLIDKRSAETVVVTPNATTVVIGGLMNTEKTSTLQKVPLLGDIPGIGLAFRHLQKHTQKRELIIFLTPYIVDSPGEFKDLTLSEANRTELLPKEFTKKEINDNLDTLQLLPPPDDGHEIRRAVRVTQEVDTKETVRPSFR
jgi:general secretion pathway protein D